MSNKRRPYLDSDSDEQPNKKIKTEPKRHLLIDGDNNIDDLLQQTNVNVGDIITPTSFAQYDEPQPNYIVKLDEDCNKIAEVISKNNEEEE